MPDFKGHEYYDDFLQDGFFCQCGHQFYPDCDASRVSINRAFFEHREKVFGKDKSDSLGILL